MLLADVFIEGGRPHPGGKRRLCPSLFLVLAFEHIHCITPL
jgi:hypothetical protein